MEIHKQIFLRFMNIKYEFNFINIKYINTQWNNWTVYYSKMTRSEILLRRAIAGPYAHA